MGNVLELVSDHWLWVAAGQLAAAVGWAYAQREGIRKQIPALVVGLSLAGGAFLLQVLLAIAAESPWGVTLRATYLFLIVCWWSWILKPAGSDVPLGPLFGAGPKLKSAPTGKHSVPAAAVALPDLNQLNHWRKNGDPAKAYHEARKAMLQAREAFPIWLFAAEMAALQYSNLQEAERIIRQLCASEAFELHEKAMAIESLQTWAAAEGYHLDLVQFSEGENGLERTPALTQASRLRAMRKYDQAVKILRQALAKNPEDLAAILLLARIYTTDLGTPEDAEILLESTTSKHQLPSAFVDFARRSLAAWTGQIRHQPKGPWWAFFCSWFPAPSPKRQPLQLSPTPAKARLTGLNGTLLAMDPSPTADLPPLPRMAPTPLPKTPVHPARETDGLSQESRHLLKTGFIGTAIEQMEQQLRESPDDYNACMQLAEIYCQSVDNLRAADDLVRRIQSNPAFNEQQKAVAQARLRDWTAQCMRRRSPEMA